MVAKVARWFALASLYLVQGLPFGFQSQALPLYLVAHGASMTQATLSGALALPWLLKPLWAPVVDSHHSPRLGRRKSWIIPLQFALACTFAATSFYPLPDGLAVVLAAMLVLNLVTATLDIAVDGLAIDTLDASEMGWGNAAQVVGYKLGMLLGGGALAALSYRMGWQGTFFAMATFPLAALAALPMLPEAKPVANIQQAPLNFWEVVRQTRALLLQPHLRQLMVVILTYKFGETVADRLFGLSLVHRGWRVDEVAVLTGTYGMAASIAGSFGGGLLASRISPLATVWWFAVLRLIPLIGQWLISSHVLETSQVTLIPTVVMEHAFGGALTTALFAWMMSQVNRTVGATAFTALAALEVAGKTPPGLFAGVAADIWGVPTTLGVSVACSVAFLSVLPRHNLSATKV